MRRTGMRNHVGCWHHGGHDMVTLWTLARKHAYPRALNESCTSEASIMNVVCNISSLFITSVLQDGAIFSRRQKNVYPNNTNCMVTDT
jgi:hypothetical protein